jgi:hypothetical protein
MSAPTRPLAVGDILKRGDVLVSLEQRRRDGAEAANAILAIMIVE